MFCCTCLFIEDKTVDSVASLVVFSWVSSRSGKPRGSFCLGLWHFSLMFDVHESTEWRKGSGTGSKSRNEKWIIYSCDVFSMSVIGLSKDL